MSAIGSSPFSQAMEVIDLIDNVSKRWKSKELTLEEASHFVLSDCRIEKDSCKIWMEDCWRNTCSVTIVGRRGKEKWRWNIEIRQYDEGDILDKVDVFKLPDPVTQEFLYTLLYEDDNFWFNS